MDEKIIRLAALQESGALPPIAEEALALTFADRYEASLRHVARWGRWLAFDGVRWHFDDTLHAFDRAREICREAALKCGKPASTVASAKTVCRCGAAGQSRSPVSCSNRAMGRGALAVQCRRMHLRPAHRQQPAAGSA
jgi:phage/plasmid-associated DNA primase